MRDPYRNAGLGRRPRVVAIHAAEATPLHRSASIRRRIADLILGCACGITAALVIVWWSHG